MSVIYYIFSSSNQPFEAGPVIISFADKETRDSYRMNHALKVRQLENSGTVSAGGKSGSRVCILVLLGFLFI